MVMKDMTILTIFGAVVHHNLIRTHMVIRGNNYFLRSVSAQG